MSSNLLSALLEVQKHAPALTKDKTAKVKTKTGGEYSYSYVGLDSITEKLDPLLHEHGLVWLTKPSHNEYGPSLKYTLAHAESGEREDGEMPLLIGSDKLDPQGQGSAITYARRYALCAVLNLVAEDDDDGQAASSGQRAGGANGRAGRPTDKQVEFLQSLVKQKKPSVAQLKILLAEIGAEDVEIEEGWASRLSGGKEGQASALIERLKTGPLPKVDEPATPPSDIPEPAQGEFEHGKSDLEGTPWAA